MTLQLSAVGLSNKHFILHLGKLTNLKSRLKTETKAYQGLVLRQQVTCFICGGFLWLDVCLGSEPSLAQSKAKIKRLWTDTLVKLPCLN
jgi:hypothetical protein